ncbi:MAG: hypothetical protein EXS13_05195 [Planctomycetes bacterium]|nr:hypothetical protein [Planctomycetota bacterium]
MLPFATWCIALLPLLAGGATGWQGSGHQGGPPTGKPPPAPQGDRPNDRGTNRPSKPERPAEKPESEPIGEPIGEPIDDENGDASRRLREAEKGLTDREPRLRAQAIDPFLVHRNELYVKRLTAMLKDEHDDVGKRAAQALANQPYASASAALLDFASNDKYLAGRPEVCAEAIRGFGRLGGGESGMGKKGFERLREKFPQGDALVKGAICQAFALAKEKRAFSFLVDQFDPPAPENPDSASNPPESYWRARHAEWSAYSIHTKRALKELTGQKFATSKEWKEWATADGAKLGFTYTKGG